MSIIDSAKEWLFSIALKKGVVSLAKLIVSYCVAHGINIVATIGGMPIDTTSEAVITALINSGLTMLRNWLKIKWPTKFGWL